MRKILVLLALVAVFAHAQKQQFFNLSAEAVKVDTLLPEFVCAQPLPENYSDSVYEVSIEYPEFIDMGAGDIRRYQRLSSTLPPEMPEVRTCVTVDRRKASLHVSFTPIVYRNGRYQKLVSFMLSTTARRAMSGAAKVRRAATSASSRYADHSVLRSGEWAKIRVGASGVYELTASLIRQAGFSDLSKVKIYGYGGALQPETLSGDYLTETDDLQEVPTCNVGGHRLFYAQGPVTWSSSGARTFNPYSDYGYYFLTQTDDEPATVDSTAFLASFYPAGEDYNTLYEVDNYAWYNGGRNLFDSQLYTIGTANSYTLASAGPSATGKLTIVLSAHYVGSGSSTATVSLNGTELGTVSVTGLSSSDDQTYVKARTGSKTFTVSNLEASNTITITQTAGGEMRLDYIAIHSDEPKVSPSLASASFPSPEYVYRITNQDHHADEAVDMVIIIPTSQKLLAQAERLKTLHEEKDSMTVRIVPADELYNEFSSGTPDATAYRRYMKMLYDRAEDESQMPRFLTLFGDAAWDNRMHCATWRSASTDDYLLCYESENSFSEIRCFVSDDFFCMLDDGERLATESEGSCTSVGKPDVAVGRFPATTEAEAKVMVDKLETYMAGTNSGSWQNTVVLMGDDGNNNTHMKAADDVATVVELHNPAMNVRRIMWDAYALESSSVGARHPDATKLIKQYMTNGALVMNYNGHGAANAISHEYVLSLSDFKTTVSKYLPLWVTASCDIMPFDGDEENIGEQALFNENGGAVAFFGTTRTVYTHLNRYMNMAFMQKLFSTDANGKRLTVGEAVRQAKTMLVDGYTDETETGSYGSTLKLKDTSQNKLQYTLLGDPALTLNYPVPTMVVDSINGVATSVGGVQTLSAGAKVKVDGRVLIGGETATDFNGTLAATVREGKQTVTCKQGRQADADTAFVFKDWQNSVFNGTDSVSAGRFSFTFVVPRDISYNDSAAQITVYALGADRQTSYSGVNSQLRLNGSSALSKDSVGPSIYCYLNSSSFTNGDAVNATPYFVAELTDEDGINASGSGIGHDLQLVIDGDAAQTYTLNDYFTFDFGSYQSGSIGYQLPTLAEGDHKLRFQAWDILNNASVSELNFKVVSGLAPTLYEVEATKNPAVTTTSFRIIHDRIGVEMTVRIELFDMAGRALWTHEVTDTPADNTLTVDWDLSIDDGRKLGTGVYLYRAGISTEGSQYTTKTKKLIIINNK